MNLYDNLGILEYNSNKLTNICRGISLIKSIKGKDGIFFPYVVKQLERPDTIAHDYYGDSDYFWLVLLCNDIFNIETQWPLSDSDFLSYIQKKYQKSAQELQKQIYYFDNPETNYYIDQQTFDYYPAEKKVGWVPVSYYDYELKLNSQKSNIKLLSKSYLPLVVDFFREKFK